MDGMKHQNNFYNIPLKVARCLREFLNQVGMPVTEILCNPSPIGQSSTTLIPEINIPDDGEGYNLEFRFQDVKDTYPVAQVLRILSPVCLQAIDNLHHTLWPNSSQSDLNNRLMTVPEIRQAADQVITNMLKVPWEELNWRA